MNRKALMVLSMMWALAALPALAGADTAAPPAPAADAVVTLAAPVAGVTAECGGSTPVAGEQVIDLREVLNGFEPVPAAPSWGCTNWGVCNVDCHTSCFKNEDCPPVDGSRQFCLCSGQCP